MKNYEPNFSDPRILRRINHSLDWVVKYVRPNRSKWLSQREIQRQFGSLSRDLGCWLRDQLLTCTNPFYDSLNGKCREYRLNQSGYTHLCHRIGRTTEFTFTQEQLQEIESGQFNERHRSERFYTDYTHLPRRIRIPQFARQGYRFEYDIECAAHSLLLQYSRQLGLTRPTPLLDQIVKDRRSFRQQLAQDFNLPQQQVKTILTALLMGASLSTWHQNRIFVLIGFNALLLKQISSNPTIQQYRLEISEMWRSIRPSLNLVKGVRFTSKKKNKIYRDLESCVGRVIRDYLNKNSVRFLWEHDGWRSDTAIDINELIRRVRTNTGYQIGIEWTIYETTESS